MEADRCRLLQTGLVNERSWNQVRDSVKPEGWVEATANGWGALVAWVTGPSNVCRWPAPARDRHIEVHVLTGGVEVHQPSVLSDADLASIDDDIDSYLADADVPPLPRGYAWYIRRPPGISSDDAFWSAINRGVQETAPEAVHPLELRLVLDGVMRSLYG